MTATSTNQKEYKWPFPLNVIQRACKPPDIGNFLDTRTKQRMDICGCGQHPHEPRWMKYQDLSDRYQKLCHEYETVLKEMAKVSSDILEDPCGDMHTKMATIYQMDYNRRGLPLEDYKGIQANDDSFTPPPSSYKPLEKDPHIRCNKWPSSSPPWETSFAFEPRGMPSKNRTPFPGLTEYEEELSMPAEAVWRSVQQYQRPRPTARMRNGAHRFM